MRIWLFITTLIFLGSNILLSAELEKWDFIELEYSNISYSGNPFLVDLTCDFTHEQGEKLTQNGFFAGNGTWKVRFMGHRLGNWTYTTSSSNSGLNNKSGKITVVPSSRTGILKGHDSNTNRWIIEDGKSIPPFAASVLSTVYSTYNRHYTPQSVKNFLAWAKNVAGASGVNQGMRNIFWEDCEDGPYTCSPSSDNLSIKNFNALDTALQWLHNNNMFAQLWFYSDDSNRPRFSGQSAKEKLLFKYTMARLSAYPKILFDSGIDILEFRSSSWNSWFADELKRLDPWDHPVGSRHGGGSGSFTCASCTYDAVGDVHPSYSTILSQVQNSRVPVFNTDNWREDYSRGNFNKDNLRQIAWECALAGGQGFVIGGKYGKFFIDSEKSYLNDLDAPEQFRFFSEFWTQRVKGDYSGFEICNDQVSTRKYCIGSKGQEYVIYLKGTNTAGLNLTGHAGSFNVEWLNPVTGARQQGSAVLGDGNRSFTAPWSESILHIWNESSVRIEDTKINEKKISLSINPNPFNRHAKLRFFLPKSGRINVTIYEINGKRISTVVKQTMKPGNHSMNFSAKGMENGVYIVRLISGDSSFSYRIVHFK